MKIEGKIATIIYKNEMNSWTVLLVKRGKEYITAVGTTTDDIDVEDEFEFEGEEAEHKVYGKQFKFSTYKKILPKTSSSLIAYIADNIKGVGKKTAKNIVDEFGDETVNIIKYQKEKLSGIKGLNDEKINELNTFFLEEWEKWNVIEFLSEFGISVLVASKIYKILGVETINIVKENPYSLLKLVRTLDFDFVDNIAKKLEISMNSEERVDAGIICAINKATEFGHTCIEYDTLKPFAAKMLNVEESEIVNGITRLNLDDKIYIEKIDDIDFVFRRSYYLAEENIAKAVVNHTMTPIISKNYSKQIEKVSEKNSLVLSKEQVEAISTCLNNSISIITGGPGTGKTTIIKCIIDILEDSKKDYVLCAPTGRASKRIKETTGKEAKTIHRLLEIAKVDDRDLDALFEIDVKTIEADVIIVDEASMIDSLMMNNLFKAVKQNTQIIFVGDVDQLPSVGPGNVLKDIIASGVVSTVSLKEIYRQSYKSDIIVNAHKVNNGEYPEFKNKDTDMFFIKSNSIEQTIAELSSLLSYRLESFADIDLLKDLQVLTPMKKTDLGTIKLNSVIQTILNPKSNKKSEKAFNGRIFREGDKVMQIINNYDKKFSQDGEFFDGIYNGDIGYIKEIDNVKQKMRVVFDEIKDVEYEFDELDQLELAYAVTIHKSQGSEFDYIIIPLYTGYPKLFTRNLLYTAMTRAKKMLIIVGNKNIVNFMVDNIESRRRKTGLKNKILKLI